jgi:hypothetical protein
MVPYFVINKKGAGTRYVIREISNANALFKVRLERVEGYDPIPIGDSVLEYYSPFVADKSVNISIGYDEYNVVFIKPINTENNILGSLWSFGTAFYSNNLLLDTDENVDLNTYYTQTVSDYGKLLRDMVKRMIPASDAVQPDAPALETENFKVVQINTHITDTANTKTLRELHAQKNQVKSVLEQNQESIKAANRELSIKQFKSAGDKQKKQEELNQLIQTQENNTKNLASITRQITDARAFASTESPKFRVRGFFPFPEPQENQEVIQYKISYRYSSTDGNFNTTEGFETEDNNGNTTTGYFSNWVEYLTKIRLREYDVTTDTWVWLDENITDAEVPNINQVDIPITNGERVEFRVKSISEAGWPDSTIESEWSDIITIDFPDEFTNLFRENDNIFDSTIKDEALIELNTDLDSRGVYRHVQDQFTVNETFYAHKDRQISTSFTDDQGNSIDLFTYLQSLQTRIQTVEEELARTKGVLTVRLFRNNQSFVLENNSIKKISVDCESYGESPGNRVERNYYNDVYIIKDFYLKLDNVSESNPLGLLSDRSYIDSTQDSTNIFFQYEDAQTIFIDEKNSMYTQRDNQFVWFADNHAGEPLSSGITDIIVSQGAYDEEHINILKSDYNIGLNVSSPLSEDSFNGSSAGEYNLLSNISWDSGATVSTSSGEDFLATVHMLVKEPEDIVDAGQEKIKQLNAGNSITIPINIYFKFDAANSDEWTADRKLRDLGSERILNKKIKLYVEKEGELRPLQYTIDFELKQQFTATYFFRVFDESDDFFD